MALRCALLGHAFGDPDVERTRTRQGERVAVTVREVRTCDRCGATDVVGERTEVTAADAGDAGAGGTASGGTEETGHGWPEGGAAAGTAPDGPRSGAADRRSRAADHRSKAADHRSKAADRTDDAVIVDDGSDSEGRRRGEWPRRERPGGETDADGPRPWPDPPDAGGETPDVEHGDWPEPRGDDDGFDARPAGGDEAGVDLDGGLTPERAGEPPDDAEFIDASSTAAEEPVVVPGEEIPPDRETEFVCPECGFAEHSAVASVRPGDVCPDCRSGYLEERPADE